MKNECNQPGLFDEPDQKKEDTMKNKSQQEAQALIDRVHQLSMQLKYKPNGILHPDRLKDQDTDSTNLPPEGSKINS